MSKGSPRSKLYLSIKTANKKVGLVLSLESEDEAEHAPKSVEALKAAPTVSVLLPKFINFTARVPQSSRSGSLLFTFYTPEFDRLSAEISDLAFTCSFLLFNCYLVKARVKHQKCLISSFNGLCTITHRPDCQPFFQLTCQLQIISIFRPRKKQSLSIVA